MAEDLSQDGLDIVAGKEYRITWTDSLTSGAYGIYQGTTKIGQVGGHYDVSVNESVVVSENIKIVDNALPVEYETVTITENVTLSI
jgi:hypothetical protein